MHRKSQRNTQGEPQHPSFHLPSVNILHTIVRYQNQETSMVPAELTQIPPAVHLLIYVCAAARKLNTRSFYNHYYNKGYFKKMLLGYKLLNYYFTYTGKKPLN